MSQSTGKSTADQKDELVEHLLGIATAPKYDGGRPKNDPDDAELMAFLEVALREVVGKLAENRAEAQTLGGAEYSIGHFDALMELFDPENVVEIDVRPNGRFHSPKVTIWLKDDPPMWGNSAWRSELTFSEHRAHYNGNPAHAVLDVRPF